MNTKQLLGALGLGLVLGSPAWAQTTVPVSGSVSNAGAIPRIPASSVPGQPGNSASEPPLTGTPPVSRPSTLYPDGVPRRDIDAGNSRAAQPRAGQAIPGAQSTTRIRKGRARSDR